MHTSWLPLAVWQQVMRVTPGCVFAKSRELTRSSTSGRTVWYPLVVLTVCLGAVHPAARGQADEGQGNSVLPPPAQASEPTVATPPPVAPAQQAGGRAAIEPPDGQWLTDEQGRSYFVERISKRNARRIDDKTVSTIWAIPLEVVREDDEYFYFKVYHVPAAGEATGNGSGEHEQGTQKATLNAEEVARVAATYRVDLKESARLRFAPFGKGLPTAGQWRDGFAVADLNGDGHLDIVHGPARKSLGPPVIFLGDGKGSWTRWREVKFPPLPYDYGDAQVGDFNGDGHADIAFAVHLRGLIVLVGDGQGNFTAAGTGLDFSSDGSSFSSRALRVVDWDGDGRLDILALGEGPRPGGGGRKPSRAPQASARGVVLYLNQGGGRWKRHEQGVGQNTLFGASITVGDFTGNGRMDFATATSIQGRKDIVHVGTEEGGWTPVPLEDLRPGAVVWAVAAGDFDHDGRDDLVVAYLSYEMATWRTGLDVFFSRAEGTWQRRALAAEEGRRGIFALGVGDLDGDANPDLVATTGSGDLWVFLGDGTGGFTKEKETVPPFVGGCRGAHVVLSDLDGDGRSEVIASFAEEPSSGMILSTALGDAPGLPAAGCPSEGGIMAWTVSPIAQ